MESRDQKRIRVAVKFARWFFVAAAIYGIPVMLGFFLHPPEMLGKAPWQQPEMYYGFATVVLAWQMVFLLIASDPIRYRPLMMIAAIFEKFAFVAVLAVLLFQRRAGRHWIPPAAMDLLWGVGFVVAFALTKQPANPSPDLSAANSP